MLVEVPSLLVGLSDVGSSLSTGWLTSSLSTGFPLLSSSGFPSLLQVLSMLEEAGERRANSFSIIFSHLTIASIIASLVVVAPLLTSVGAVMAVGAVMGVAAVSGPW